MATDPLKDRRMLLLGMSNIDQSIDAGLEEALKNGLVQAQHAGWNFCGYVWWDGEQFCEQVWHLGSLMTTIKAATLHDLRRAVNDEYGYE